MINILSKDTIDKIAAGEVAERPESVVKELLDNAVDSGADKISIEIRSGGLDLIRVTDNGCGIDGSEVKKAFLRHATSKLRTAEDLEHIMSMGFRGEALASIASVASVEMITKTADSLCGTDYRIEFGVEIDIREVGVPDGTTVIVRDFLENVPVRRQFLKSPKTESSYIVNTVEKTALAHPEISITLNTDGRCAFATNGNGRSKDVIYTLFGSAAAASLREVDYIHGSIRVRGYAAEPGMSRSRRDQEIFFVNGRWISSEILRRGLEDAFSPYLMQHRYPFSVLNITLPPEDVDVNVHPRKSEVRFARDQEIYDAVFSAVSEAMSEKELIADAGRELLMKQENRGKGQTSRNTIVPPEPFEVKRSAALKEQIHQEVLPFISGIESVNEPTDGRKTNYDAETLMFEKPAAYGCQAAEDDRCAVPPEKPKPAYTGFSASDMAENGTGDDVNRLLSKRSLPYLKMVGQVFDTYWIIEYNDEMYIVDQHAAHEKVNYERYTVMLRNHTVESQMLYPPIVLTLGAKEAALLERNLDFFTDAGYDIEYAGDRDFAVRAVPSNLPELSDSDLLMSLIDSMFEDGKEPSSAVLKDRIASMSCKAAVKGNRPLSELEMKHLIEELLTLENPYNCPHGRPTIIRFSRQDIEKLFRRII